MEHSHHLPVPLTTTARSLHAPVLESVPLHRDSTRTWRHSAQTTQTRIRGLLHPGRRSPFLPQVRMD